MSSYLFGFFSFAIKFTINLPCKGVGTWEALCSRQVVKSKGNSVLRENLYLCVDEHNIA